MLLKFSVIILCLVISQEGFCRRSSTCKISKWIRLNMMELLTISQTVVLGRESSNITLFQSVYSSFEVLCVLKNDGSNVKENITIFSVLPASKCSGTAGRYQQGDLVILGLKRISDHTFQWDEHVPITSMAFAPTFENLWEISSTCGLQSWSKPTDAVMDNCPLCSNDLIFQDQNITLPTNTTCFAEPINAENCTMISRPTVETICACSDSTVTVEGGVDRSCVNVALILMSIILILIDLG